MQDNLDNSFSSNEYEKNDQKITEIFPVTKKIKMKKDLDKSEGCWYRFLKFYTNHLIMAKSQLIFSIKG